MAQEKPGLSNTIVAQNTEEDCAGTLVSLGHNLFGSASCSAGATDLLSTTPGLQPAFDESGYVWLYRLSANSPAVDAAAPSMGATGCSTLDQVGTQRPKDGDDDGVAECDIGAFERPDTPPSIASRLPASSNVSPRAAIVVEFSEPMNRPVTEAAFSLVRMDTGAAVSGTFTWDGNKLTFRPDQPLAGGVTYRATISTAATDVLGTSLQVPLQWEFTVAVAPADEPVPPSPPGTTPPPPSPEPAIARLWLRSRCLHRSRSGQVRIRMYMRMARPGPLRIRIDRAVGSRNRRNCPRPNPTRHHTTRFKPVKTVHVAPTQAIAASVPRQTTLRLRPRPGLYRLTVQAQLEGGGLSRPIRRFLRVVG